MKILVVTSEVTFVPDNYNHFLENLFKNLTSEKNLDIQLVVLKNNSLDLPLKGFALATMGARSIGGHLIKNSLMARLNNFYQTKEKIAKKYKINLHYFLNPNSPDFHEFVKNEKIDLIINARTRFIYKSKILKLPKISALNIHHGLLPDYRGTMCDLWALLDERPTGFTIHVMEKKIDDGAIVHKMETSHAGDNLRKNFSQLILESSKIEGVEMAKIIKQINITGTVPIKEDNISPNPIYTKNPDFYSIRQLIQKGIEL
ncbi:MAG: hypothetical protein K2Q18_10805 [Bdellovibrionales bacterium]|nr:hypothetical protein [Bdellovibrionales bacterium]